MMSYPAIYAAIRLRVSASPIHPVTSILFLLDCVDVSIVAIVRVPSGFACMATLDPVCIPTLSAHCFGSDIIYVEPPVKGYWPNKRK